jgi:hypothetical protein
LGEGTKGKKIMKLKFPFLKSIWNRPQHIHGCLYPPDRTINYKNPLVIAVLLLVFMVAMSLVAQRESMAQPDGYSTKVVRSADSITVYSGGSIEIQSGGSIEIQSGADADISGATVTSSTFTSPTITTPTVTGGSVSNATISDTTVSGGSVSNASISNATVTGGSVSNATISSSTITCGTDIFSIQGFTPMVTQYSSVASASSVTAAVSGLDANDYLVASLNTYVTNGAVLAAALPSVNCATLVFSTTPSAIVNVTIQAWKD